MYNYNISQEKEGKKLQVKIEADREDCLAILLIINNIFNKIIQCVAVVIPSIQITVNC